MMRRIIAENLDWSLSTVPCLSKLCLQSIVNNFQEKPIYEELTPSEKDFIQKRLPLSLPLHFTANFVPDGVFWKRCCEQKWTVCDVSNYGESWKRMFFERHLENIIELFIPGVTEPKTVLDMVALCKDHIKKLDISQLLPPVKLPQTEEKEQGSELTLENEDDDTGMDHFDISILLDKLTNLEEIHLVYQVKSCGMNFEWSMFELTHRDCESLGKAVESCKTLKLFRLYLSHLEDKKCRLLVKYLLDHPSLSTLDFSHNVIGDSGARAIGKLLTRSKLKVLKLSDNNIGGPGAKAIAHALSKNTTLVSLNLRLNRLKDEGGQAICKALLSNKTLLHLHLGANEMTWCTVLSLSKVLAQNKTLKSINLSCNKLGEVGGEALEEAMSQNTSLTECDIRLTDIEEKRVSVIDRMVWNNQFRTQETSPREHHTPK
ncbi:dynein regulatory complex subunit 5 [Archocentrus centrarchus]|uniref:dynein regulatory complex subunit 5 n=1 Tax=Archocentrus centrarchus TaxID=63155 RepID=UPI0011EA4EFF|nr:dynein regulatory complex subunit 5 [Archocentrus centrarchus]XP_030577687.1 dynein regulatory complex subunit 5 [Archocentrus centrarchus]XP_030577688.1 dynein regulatory complex subunit 5 [Archocentrus centrarchus]